MHNLALPVVNLERYTEEELQHQFPIWEQEVLSKLDQIGYPMHLWPSGTLRADSFVRAWMVMGLPRSAAPTNAVMNKAAPYDGPTVPEPAARLFNASFNVMQDAIFCITKGEDWWPHNKAFLCNDASSYMLSCLYTAALMNPKIMESTGEKKKGRPRDDAAHAAKADKSSRYQQWLVQCEEYRGEIAQAENAYIEAKKVADNLRAQLNTVKARGAPKWIP